jgi:hypothetical protein
VPSGTRVTLSLANGVAMDRDQPGDPWSGTTVEDVRVNGTAALGALVGILTDRNHQGDHALGGAAAGAVAGPALAAGTADPVLRIPAGQPITFSLSRPGAGDPALT